MKRLSLIGAPAIWRSRPRTAEIEIPKLLIGGHFEWELVHARTGLIARRGRGPNMIVDQGLNFLGTNEVGTCMTYCGVGTGTTDTTADMVDLEAEVLRTNSAGGFAEEPGAAGDLSYTFFRRTRVFTQAQANGNLSEVGMLKSTGTNQLFCRQLIRDELGDPTVIVKTDEYELRVTYEIRWYPPVGDTVYSMMLNGVATDVTTRPAMISGIGVFSGWYAGRTVYAGVNNAQHVTLYSGALGARTSRPAGTDVVASYSRDAYVNNSNQMVMRASWGASVANTTVWQSIGTLLNGASTPGYLAFQHQPAGAGFSKNNTQRFDIVWTHTWDRAA